MDFTLALIDAGFYGHRCRFSNSVFFGHRPVGVLHALFEAAIDVHTAFGAKAVAFAFDARHSVRKRDYPWYKSARADARSRMSEADRAVLEAMYAQMDKAPGLLAECGFDVLVQNGMEADDVIAMACRNYPNEKIIIVSPDRDLYQLIGNGTVIAKPKGMGRYGLYGYRNLKDEYGIEPYHWPWVKAIAGCDSDNVPSVGRNVGTGELEYRIGEVTALKYLRGELDENGGIYKFLKGDEANSRFKRNWELVRLPHNRTKPVILKMGRPGIAALRRVFEEFGLSDMLDGRWDEWKEFAGEDENPAR